MREREWAGGGRAALVRWAPDAATLVADVGGLRAATVDEATYADERVAAFAEQFGVDVTGVDDVLRAGLAEAAGDQLFAVVQQVYVDDFWPRLQAGLDALFGASSWPVRPPTRVDDLWPHLDAFMRAVARLSALDPALTELVRLRGARQHDCRLCRSRRSVEAIEAGADETMFDAVDHHAVSGLSAAAKAALALTDAVIWTPFAVPAPVVDAVRGALTAAQAVEVLLDVTRNAANKIAVALAADAPEVVDGVQLFTTDADGILSTVP